MKHSARSLLSVLLLGLASCGETPRPAPELGSTMITTQPLQKPSAPQGKSLFTRLTPAECGIDFTNPLDTQHPLKRLYAGGYAVGGVAIGDVNGDALPDVYFVSGPRTDRLFIQTGNLTFEDATESAGLGDSSHVWGTGAAMVDIDNDHDLDIYVCRYDSPNALFINNGRGHFQEKSEAFGLNVTHASLMPTFADYDNDGDLDLYVLTNLYYREHGMPRDATFMTGNEPKIKSEYRKWVAIRPAGTSLTHKRYELYPVGQRDVLLKNENGVFRKKPKLRSAPTALPISMSAMTSKTRTVFIITTATALLLTSLKQRCRTPPGTPWVRTWPISIRTADSIS